MALQFIFGNSGSGKSWYLYHEIIKRSMEHPEKQYIAIVPEQFTMQTQKDFVTMHPNRGIMNIDVLSFVRLAHHVFEETGGIQRTVLDDTGKSLVLRKVAEDLKGELPVLGSSMKKAGYISEVKSLLSEFTQYDIEEEDFEKMEEILEKNSYFYLKMQDIRKIYTSFFAYLEGTYITGEELLSALCPVVGQSKKLKGSTVVLDGFTGFTPVQHKVLRELLRVCEDVIVTVTIDEKENPYVYRHPYELFALSKQMVVELTKLAKEERVEILEPVSLFGQPKNRFWNNEPLAFLEQHLFRYSNRTYEKAQEALSIHCAPNPRKEVMFAASKIRELVRKEGYRYRDIAVIMSDAEVYKNHVEQMFASYELPVFLDHKRSILLNSFVEYIRSLLAMAEQNFTYESVFRHLRTGLSDFEEEEIDRLENYVIALGIKGYKKWQAPWIRRGKYTTEEDLAKLNQMRTKFVEQVDGLLFILKKRKKTVRDMTLALYEYLVKEEMQKKMKAYEEWFTARGALVLAKEYGQIYRIVIELLEKFEELLGDETVTLREYCDLLDAGFEEAKVGVIPPGLDQIMAGDMERTRMQDVKAVFLLGANDTAIPGTNQGGGLLSEAERERFADAKIALAPSAKERLYTQKFYLYQTMTKPTEKLYVTYSKTSSDGKSVRPAYLIGDLKRLYPKLSVVDEEQRGISDMEFTKKQGLSYVVEGLRNRKEEPKEEWKELYTYYKGLPEWQEQLEELLNAVFYKKPQDALSRAVAKQLYRNMEYAGVTRLERFSSCAFSHFLTYGLRLEGREEYEFASLDLGNIFHKTMERYSKELERRNLTWTDIAEEERDALIDECVDSSIVDYGNTVLYSSARDEYMITRIRRLVKRSVWAMTEQLKRGDFIPSEYEISFGKGKIDRIDTYEENGKVYVKVIDYKTGSKEFDLSALYYGLQMQLAFYMNAALELERKKHPGKEIIPAGIFYYKTKDPFVEKKGDEEVGETILKELKLDGLVNGRGDVIEHLDKNFEKQSAVVPITKTKSGYAAYSRMLSEQGFQVMSDYVEQKAESIRRQILNGTIEIDPYEMGQSKGCDYCPYQGICRFDEKIPGYDYRKIPKMKREEVLNKMQEEM